MPDTSRIFVSPRDLIGVELDGRYRIHSIVGGGGMGIVFRTQQTNLGRDIALKLLRFDENKSDRRLERFLREIDLISQFTHPNIVRIFDSGRDRHLGLFYIAMELIEGLPLDRILDRHLTTAEFALEVAYQTLAALTEPHAAGIIHRDIKPANLLLKSMSDDTIQVKVVDFGIARAANPTDEKITTTGVVVGTPAYMAPELAVAGDVDARSDLYSIGVLIYEMLSGQRPFTGDTPVAILLRHAVDAPPSLSSVIDDFAYPEIVDLVDRLLSKEPEGRPPDARAVRAEIDAIRDKYELQRPRIEPNELPFAALAPYLRERPGGPLGSRATLQEVDSDMLTDPMGETTTWSTIDADAIETADSGGWLVSQDALSRVPRFDPHTGEMVSLPETPAETLITPALSDDGPGDSSDTSQNLPVRTDPDSAGLEPATGGGVEGAGPDGPPPHAAASARRPTESAGTLPWLPIVVGVVVIGLAVWAGTLLTGGEAVATSDDAGAPAVLGGATIDADATETSPTALDAPDDAPDDEPEVANDSADTSDAGTTQASPSADPKAEPADTKPPADPAPDRPKNAGKSPPDKQKDTTGNDGASATPDAGESIPGLKWLKEK